jgi:cell division protein FtsL
MSPSVQSAKERPSASGVKDRRLLYNSRDSETASPNKLIIGGLSFPKRRSSTFNVIAILFLAAVAIVLYINNIIAVNRLVVEVGELEQKYATVVNSNEILRAEINRRSSLERIGRIASEQLGLQHPKQQPQVLDVDGKLMNNR